MAALRVLRIVGGVSLDTAVEGSGAGTETWVGTAYGSSAAPGSQKLRVERIAGGVSGAAVTPPVVLNTTTLIGARVNLPGSASETAEFATGEVQYGELQCTKDYWPGGQLPMTYNSPFPARVWILLSHAQDTIFGWATNWDGTPNPNADVARWTSYINSLPVRTILTFQHEPERPWPFFGSSNPSGPNPSAVRGEEYVDKLNRYRQEVRAVRTDIQVWMFTSGYQYRTNKPGYSGRFFSGPRAANPQQTYTNNADGFGYDGYRAGTDNVEQGNKVIPLQNRNEFMRWHSFIPEAKITNGAWGASEVGFGRVDDPPLYPEPGVVPELEQQRIDGVRDSVDWLIAQGARMFLYFMSGEGPDLHNWLPTSPAFKTMFKALPRLGQAVSTGEGSAEGWTVRVGTATGSSGNDGAGVGTIVWAGTAAGIAPPSGIQSGTAAGSINWIGNVVGASGGIPVVIPYTGTHDEATVLAGPRITDYRFDLLDGDENLIGSLATVVGGSVDWVARNAIKGGGVLEVDGSGGDVDWLNVRIRPWVIFEHPDVVGRAEVPVGVFLPAAPVETWDAMGRSWSVELLDKNSILDQDIVTDEAGNPVTYAATAGSNVVDTVIELIVGAGEATPAILPSARILPSSLVWDLGTTRLTIINDLLDASNHFSLWCDPMGQFQVTPYVAPEDRQRVYSLLGPFTKGERSLMAPEWSRDQDIYAIPNRYVAATTGSGDTAALVSVATNMDPASPFSYPSRGRWITRVLTNAEAASQDDLDSIARRGLTSTTSVTSSLTVAHVFLPDIRVWAVVGFTNADAALDVLCEVNKTSVPFDPTALCKSELREVAVLP